MKNLSSSKRIETAIIKKSMSGEFSVADLVLQLKGQNDSTEDKIAAKIMELRASGKVRLIEKDPFLSLGSYLLSPYSIWFWLTAFATLLSFDVIFFSPGPAIYLRYIFGGLLILFLPGFTLVELLYAKKKELDNITRLTLSIGLSLSSCPPYRSCLELHPVWYKIDSRCHLFDITDGRVSIIGRASETFLL